ncbi:MAG: hypothetical protein OJF59_000576 [Cytophagales bacterium]|jgi:hypothetical protein|nr:helix-turn-helix domain-containing protein [Bacteroidota bacterium]WHZ06823.1 MAG: hypothetical protein OJF59_000576 [Cytophagales bacterium]
MSEIVIIPKTELDDLRAKVDHLIKLVSDISSTSDKKKVITNDQLIADYGISKKTAQNWRTNGVIRFMRVGRKIYYNTEDVLETLRSHSHDAFKRKSLRP